MRIDARNLLDRLGKQDFVYKEFEDRFSELELWPILEALLRDPRMQAIDQAQNAATSTPHPEPARTEARVDAGAVEPLNSMFSRYGGDHAAAPADHTAPNAAPAHDVRAVLRQLSENGSQGEN